MAEKEVFGFPSLRNGAFDRAVRQLKVAEANLESITGLLDGGMSFTMADLIANAEARTRLGLAWLDVHLVVMAPDPPAPRAAPREEV
jgi:hypothetical protein